MTFLFSDYIPELKIALKGVQTPSFYKVIPVLLGVSIKLIYAFSFQEEKIKLDELKSDWMLKLGGWGIALMTAIADTLTGFP